jgi:hypothetical protein
LATRLPNSDKRKIRLPPPELPERNCSLSPEVPILLLYFAKFRLSH